MTPKLKAYWRARVIAESDRFYRSAVRLLRAELVTVADEVEANSFDQIAHAQRVEEIFSKIYAATGAGFALIGREMLGDLASRSKNPIRGAHRAEQSMERSAIERALADLDRALAKLGGVERREDYAFFGARVSELIRLHGPSRAVRLSQTTRRIITETLAQAASEGLSEAAAARRVRSAVSGQVGLARARTIARTEVGAAQNAGMLAAADEVGARVLKTWVAIHDGRTRPTHALADGQEAGPGQKFQVGDSQLEYPGDPNGLPEEVINCRCTMFLEHAP